MNKQFVRRFATRTALETLPRPGPWGGKGPISLNQLGKARRPKYHGYLGNGEPLTKDYKRRWRGGRYNYFDWNTLLQCINKCPSVIERDRMPSPRELNYYYRGAQIGVRHHGGFDVVAQILNLRPYRPYLMKKKEYPEWIEEEWIEKKMSDDSSSTSSLHRHAIPDYLSKDSKVKNIKGKFLTNRDKSRIIHEIYKKISTKEYESDVERREAIKYEYQMYKAKLRNDIVLQEEELGFALDGVRQRNIDRQWIKNEMVESDKHTFDRKLYSANGEHILFSDPSSSSHIDDEEKEYEKGSQTRRSRIKNKLTSFFKKRKLLKK